jgi:hypothetical protein
MAQYWLCGSGLLYNVPHRPKRLTKSQIGQQKEWRNIRPSRFSKTR